MGKSDGSVIGMTKIVDHGDPSQRWNLVILSEGYQSTQLDQFHSDVQDFVKTMYQTPPYDEMWCGINIYRIDVSSTDSGAADPVACGGTGYAPHTYFDARFCGDGQIQRLLTVNDGTVHDVVNAQLPQAHMILVIVNSTEYGGSGGSVATFSLASGADEIGLHEMGHTAFGFADEYCYYQGCGIDKDRNNYTGAEPGQPNITADANRTTIKWGSLIAASTPLPTMTNPDCSQCNNGPSPVSADTVGAFEGAGYYHCGLYRGQYACRMRALGNAYCAVCQQVIRQTLAPYMPSWIFGTNTIGAGETQDWWLWWPGYPGFEVIGVQVMTQGSELRTDTPGIQQNGDGSTTYFISVINPESNDVEFHFRGSAL
jgi:IgA peptidase M64